MPDFRVRFDRLRQRFLAQLADEAAMLTADAGAGDWIAVRNVCHGLSGRAGMFGFHAIGEAARAVEEGIDADGRAEMALLDRLLTLIDDVQAA